MKISFDSFLAVLGRSGLIPADKLPGLLSEYQASHPGPVDAQAFAESLVAGGLITPWQGEKLLQGKHKGFFLGKYRLLSLLGKGGMSSVYLAEHVLMRRRCAIKVLPTKRVHDSSYLGRFHREAQAVAALDHPNIVRAYDVDHEQDGTVEIHFLVMEYIDGRSLLELVNRDGPLSPVAAAEYVRQSALGLEHAHRAGLIHRDVKPGNLLVDNSGVVKVMDLGLARFFTGDDEESLTIQYDEKVLGTADYLAPEQAVDSHGIDARADIYSLGCTLYFLLAGHPPFPQGTLPQRLMAHQTKEPPPIREKRPEVPEELAAIMQHMMAKQPGDRYESASAVAEALLEWLLRAGGAEWDRFRARLAEAGIDPGSSSVRIGANKAAELSTLAERTGSSAASGGPQTAASSGPVTPPLAAPAGDPDLGAFLASLSHQPVAKEVPPATETSATSKGKPVTSSSRSSSAAAPLSPALLASATQSPVPQAQVPSSLASPDSETRAVRRQKSPASGEDAGKTSPQGSTGSGSKLPAPKTPAKSLSSGRGDRAVGGGAQKRSGGTHSVASDEGRPSSATAKAHKEAAAPVAAGPVSAVATELEAGPTAVGGAGRNQRLDKRMQTWFRSLPARKRSLVLGGTAVGAALLVGVLVLLFGSKSSTGLEHTAPVVAPANATEPREGEATSVRQSARPSPENPLEVTVGTNGHFATLAEAIRHYRTSPPPSNLNDSRVVLVEPGVYSERLELVHWNLGGLQIRPAGDGAVVLKSPGGGPALRIDTASKLRIEGLQIDAGGQPDAVVLLGSCNAVSLVGLEISGFTRSGVSGEQVTGLRNGRIELTDLSIVSNDSDAIGIRFHFPDSGVIGAGLRYLTISGCRLIGPMQIGIDLEGSQTGVEVRKNRCLDTRLGVRLGWSGRDVQAFVLDGNTICRSDEGVSIDGPPETAGQITLQKNLFAKVPQALVIRDLSDSDRMGTLQSAGTVRFNATDGTAAPGGAGTWDLFADQGQTGVDPGFVSLERGEEFLLPTNGALKVSRAPGQDKFIGAVPPR